MPRLAAAGYHVIAPDLRGYGRTDGTDVSFDDDLMPFRMLNRIADMVGLVSALGYRTVDVVGHDFGSPVAAWCALARPDLFRSVVLMSAPFGGTPALGNPAPASRAGIQAELAALDPPRKHYQWHYSSRAANDEMWGASQGVHAFLRAYYHMKSGDWKGNEPFRLAAWSGPELAKMPRYYIMDLDRGMAETVAAEMPSAAEIAACEWLTDDALVVYSAEYSRTGFQGGLNSYRVGTTGLNASLQQAFAGRTIDQPSLFIAGRHDWGVYQRPGAVERMADTACTDMKGVHLVDGAGHWVQQEQPVAVSEMLVSFWQGLG
jgi:pimeloyl-ACP methyl ester carboxylesterase